MNVKIQSTNIIDQLTFKTFSLEAPTKCPCCHTALVPTLLSSFYICNSNNGDISSYGSLYSTYYCPDCNCCFLAEYAISIGSYQTISKGTLLGVIPYGREKTAFSDNIVKCSPQFIKIYNQAEQAEGLGLTEICGMGYRKSLEFLIKDYALFLAPNKTDEIEKANLSTCIDNYIGSTRIKSLAKASAWLGNDETHYVKKHTDYDVQDLKAFIKSTVAFIDSDLYCQMAEDLLSK